MFGWLLHRDPGVRACLKAWEQGRTSGAAIAARRLFRNLAEMQDFFQMMLPGSIPINTHRYIVDTAKFGPWSFDALKTLQALEYLKAEKWNLGAAAFLIHGWNCAAAQSLDVEAMFFGDRLREEARRFVRYFDGIPYSDLMKMLTPGTWLSLDIYTHRINLYRDGISAEYIGQMTGGRDGSDKSYAHWSAYTVKSLYAEGVPAEYIRAYWHAHKDFEHVWGLYGVPAGIAIACKEAGMSPTETVEVFLSDIPLEYALATRGQ